MYVKELNGRKLKKDLEADVVRKTYHNKHVDGSGNFGFVIRRQNQLYRIDGDYNRFGQITHLDFGDYAGYYRQSLSNILYITNELLQYKTVVERIKNMMYVVENKHIEEVS